MRENKDKMSMKNENVKSEIKKEQLLSEQAFINYCNYDEANIHGVRISRLDIDQRFIKAAEKDGFIKPLLKLKELVKREDGNEKLEIVKYYSPFQVYLVLALSKNIIDDDGYLRSPADLEWQKEKGFRWVSWGWSGHSLIMDKKRQWSRKMEFATDNLPLFCDYFHRFLTFLHTLELKPEHFREFEERRQLPSLTHNLEPLRNNGLKLLKSYKLDIKILNLLRKSVGDFAVSIDPLEHWYYYIKRHPQFRKDLLKGDAALAQRLYEIYDLLTEIVEIVTGKKSEPLFEFLYQDFPGYPFLIPQVEYREGEDVKALQFAIQQFKKWKKKKENKPFVTKEIMEKLDAVEKKIKDYEQRYGDRSYAGSVRTIEAEENIKFENLDEETKKDVEDTLRQMREQKMKIELEQEIALAIEHRLFELKRELQGILWDVSGKLRDKENEWWQKGQNFDNVFWMTNREKLAKLPREEQLKLFRKEYDKIVKKAKEWGRRRKEFANSVSRYANLAFCKVCRKNPIQLHIENTNLNMWEVSRTGICDECMRTKKLETMKPGEWKCSCGKILYKFVHNNTIALRTENQVDIKLEIAYGKNILEATCPECGRKNQRIIEWGWMP
ncbi:MAG: hypothetical protein ACPLXB_01175 [Minisyncoccia bacterium]